MTKQANCPKCGAEILPGENASSQVYICGSVFDGGYCNSVGWRCNRSLREDITALTAERDALQSKYLDQTILSVRAIIHRDQLRKACEAMFAVLSTVPIGFSPDVVSSCGLGKDALAATQPGEG